MSDFDPDDLMVVPIGGASAPPKMPKAPANDDLVVTPIAPTFDPDDLVVKPLGGAPRLPSMKALGGAIDAIGSFPQAIADVVESADPIVRAYERALRENRPAPVVAAIERMKTNPQGPPTQPRQPTLSDQLEADGSALLGPQGDYLREIPPDVRRSMEDKPDGQQRASRAQSLLKYKPTIKAPQPDDTGEIAEADRDRHDGAVGLETLRRQAIKSGDLDAAEKYEGWLKAIEDEGKGGLVTLDRKAPREEMERAMDVVRGQRDQARKPVLDRVIADFQKEDRIDEASRMMTGDEDARQRILSRMPKAAELHKLIGEETQGLSSPQARAEARAALRAEFAADPVGFLTSRDRMDVLDDETRQAVEAARSPERVAAMAAKVSTNAAEVKAAAEEAMKKHGRMGDAEILLVLQKVAEYSDYTKLRPKRGWLDTLAAKWDGGDGAARAASLGLYTAAEFAELQNDIASVVEGTAKPEILSRIYDRLEKMAENSSPATFMGEVSRLLADMPEFMLAFGASGRAVSAGKAGAMGHVTNLLKESAKRTVSPAMIGMHLKAGLEEAVGKSLDGKDFDIASSLVRTLGQGAIEIFSESTGTHVFGPAFGKLSKSARIKALMKGVEQRWIKLAGGRTAGAFAKAVKEGGFDGVLSEVLEERVGDVLRYGLNAATGEPNERLFPELKQLAIEGVAFSVLPGAQVAMNQTLGRILDGGRTKEAQEILRKLRAVPGNENLTLEQIREKAQAGEEIPGLDGILPDNGTPTTKPDAADSQGPGAGGPADGTRRAASLSQPAADGLARFQADYQAETGDTAIRLQAVEPVSRGEKTAAARAEQLGVELVFVSAESGDTLELPGYYAKPTTPGGRGVLYIESGASHMATMGLFHHEWTHDLEARDPSGFAGLVKVLRAEAPDLFTDAGNSYFKKGETPSETRRTSESAAVMAEDLTSLIISNSLTDARLSKIAKSKPGVFRRVLAALDRVLARMGFEGAFDRTVKRVKADMDRQQAAAVLAFRNVIAKAIGQPAVQAPATSSATPAATNSEKTSTKPTVTPAASATPSATPQAAQASPSVTIKGKRIELPASVLQGIIDGTSSMTIEGQELTPAMASAAMAQYMKDRADARRGKKPAASTEEEDVFAGAKATATQEAPDAPDAPADDALASAVYGRTDVINLPDGSTRTVRYAAVEARELTPSHNPLRNFEQNPDGDANERPYHDPKQGKASRETVKEIAQIQRPGLLLSDTTSPTDGPPIATAKGVIIGGNARTMGMQLAYNGPAAARLREAVDEAASKFGIDAAALAEMEAPVIVRIVDKPGARGELSRLLNESFTTAKTSATDAASRGKKVSPATTTVLANLLANEGGEELSLRDVLADPAKNVKLLRRLLSDGAWNEADVIKHGDPKTGLLSAAGKILVEETLLGRLIEDPAVIGKMRPAVANKLLGAMGRLVTVIDGRPDFLEVLRTAAAAMPGFQASGLSVNDYFFDQPTLGEQPLGWEDVAVASTVHALDVLGPRQFRDAVEDLADRLGITESEGGTFGFARADKTVTLTGAVWLSLGAGVKGPGIERAAQTFRVKAGGQFARPRKPIAGQLPLGTVDAPRVEATPDARLFDPDRAYGVDRDIDPFGLPVIPKPLPTNHPLLQPTMDEKTGKLLRTTVTLTSESAAVKAKIIGPGTHDRVKFHELLVRHFLSHAEKIERPTVWFTGGGGGAGKSSVLKIFKDAGTIPKKLLEANADEFKVLLPEFENVAGFFDGRGASVVHEESSHLAKQLINRLIGDKLSFIYDATLANRPKTEKLIAQFREAGYEVELVGVTVDPYEALVRAALRAEHSWRFVPPTELLKAHKGFNAAALDYLLMFDRASIWSNDGRHPQLIVEKTAESNIKVLLQEALDDIIRRGGLNDQAKSRNELRTHFRSSSASSSDARRGGSDGREAAPGARSGALRAEQAGLRNEPGDGGGIRPGPGRSGSGQPAEIRGAQGADSLSGQRSLTQDEARRLFARRRISAVGQASMFDAPSEPVNAPRPNPRPAAKPDSGRGGDNAGGLFQRPAELGQGPRQGDAAKPGAFGGLFDFGSEPDGGLGDAGQPGSLGSGDGGSDGGQTGTLGTEGNDAGGADGLGSGDDAAGPGPDGVSGGAGSGVSAAPVSPVPRNRNWSSRNFTIDAGEDVAPPTPSGKFAANLAAITLIKQLEAEGRQATADEQQILVRYTGWGWAGELFNEEKDDKRRDRLRSLLTDAEYEAAKASITNAHYTSPQVIGAMWSMVRRLGFTGGRVLEPAMGVGHFFGAMPADLRDYSDPIGVELDNLSAAISKQLYPDFDIRHDGFEKTRIPNNSIDLAISNVPFGSYDIAGSDYNNLRIHDYFFARALDKVKPGGIVAFITSHWTMDKSSRKVRELLASKGDLVAAVRLPATAFAKNAGTEVTTDILIFRKHDGKPFPMARQFNGLTTVGTDVVTNGGISEVKPILINEYFAAHPDDAIGQHSLQGSMRTGKGEYTLLPPRGGQAAIEEQMAAAIDRLPANVAGQNAAEQGPEIIAADSSSRNFSFVEKDGQIYQVMGDALVVPDWLSMTMRGEEPTTPIDEKTKQERIQIARDWMKLRDAARSHLALENDIATPPEQLAQSRRGLTLRYDAYVGRHGTLTRQQRHLERAFFLEEDPSYPFVQGVLENERITIDPVSGKEKYEYVKGDVFRKRIREPKKAPNTAANAADAVAISMGYSGSIDVPYIQGLLGLATPEEAASAIAASGAAFLDPESGLFDSQDRYLSGNVRAKLAKAREAAQSDARFKANVTALEAVQPPRKPLSAVTFNLGARWLPADVLSAFATQLFNQPVTVTYSDAANAFSIGAVGKPTPESLTTYGSPRMHGLEIFHHMIDGTNPKVFDAYEDEHGNKKRVVNKAASGQARKAGEKIKEAFRSWVRTSDKFIGTREQIPAEILENAYNDRYNSVVPPQYNGSYLVLPGATNYVYRKAHRLSVVARILQERSGVMAHGVGSGKTVSQIVAAMELRRLGLAKKPMIVVHKATIGQFAAEFMRAYPDAKLLVANERTFKAMNRKRFMSRIAGGDYDAVIVTQPQFDRLQSSERTITSYFQEKINQFEAAIREEEANERKNGSRTKSRTQKQLEAMKRSLEVRMAKKLAAIRKLADQTVAFEELGVDFLLIDEAHAYKRLPIITRRTQVKGIPTGASDKAMNLDMKRRSVQDKQNGRGVVMATGTPITNTMAEVYVMLALGAPHVLEEYGITNFDHFANTFGEMQEKLEFTWSGKWAMVERFNKFTNGRELINMIRSGFDVKMGNERLGLDVPKMRNDQIEIQVVPQTPASQKVTDWLLSAANQFETTNDKRDVSWVPIVVMGTGMSAAVDPRLVDKDAEDHPQSKVNVAVRRVAAIHRESTPIRGTQLILVDRFAYKEPERLLEFAGGVGSEVEIEETEAPVDEEAADAPETSDEDHRAKMEDAEFKSGGFNLYRDIKAKLILMGIPADEIALIHEYNTDKQREKLFAAVNAGKVRVLLGSTEKLGVGVNIQARLVAMHQLDPPRSMTPAMAAQRMGRIIRQGNIFATPKLPDGSDNPTYNPDFRVDVIAYGLERSMDVGIYQMLESKGRFITQALLGELESDTFEDAADELTMSNSQIKAKLSGNQDALLLVELQHKVRSLRSDRDGFENQISDNQRRRADLLRSIAFLERDIPMETAVADGLEKAFPGGEAGDAALTFTQPNGRTVTGREPIVEAVSELFRTPGTYNTKINGYPLQLKVVALEEAQKEEDQKGKNEGYQTAFGAEAEGREAAPANTPKNAVHYSLATPGGYLLRNGRYVRGGNHLLNMVHADAKAYRNAVVTHRVEQLADERRQIPAIEQALTETWGGAADLARAERELAAVERRLQGTPLGEAYGIVLRPDEPTRSMRRSERERGQFARRRDQTETPEFKAWFGDSKFVDEAGKPIVFAHGSEHRNLTQFDHNRAGGLFWFSRDRGTAEAYARHRAGMDLSDERAFMNAFDSGELQAIHDENVVDVYLSAQNPLDLTTAEGMAVIGTMDQDFNQANTTPDQRRQAGNIISLAAGDLRKAQYLLWTTTQSERLDGVWLSIIVPQLQAMGYDGLIMPDAADTGISYAVFEPTQIKSATNNSGAFDASNPDIRFARRRTIAGQMDIWPGESAATDTPAQSAPDRFLSREEVDRLRQERNAYQEQIDNLFARAMRLNLTPELEQAVQAFENGEGEQEDLDRVIAAAESAQGVPVGESGVPDLREQQGPVLETSRNWGIVAKRAGYNGPGTYAMSFDQLRKWLRAADELGLGVEARRMATGNLGVAPKKDRALMRAIIDAAPAPQRVGAFRPRGLAFIDTPKEGDRTGRIVYYSGTHNADVAGASQRRDDLGLVVSPLVPHYVDRIPEYKSVIVDNGAFSSVETFNPARFRALLANIGPESRARVAFVVAPDVVGDHARTTEQFHQWADVIKGMGFPVAYVLQDGIEWQPEMIPWDKLDALFIGGSTDFKVGVANPNSIQSMSEIRLSQILREARDRNVRVHMGRVNSWERMQIAGYGMGAGSVDGTFIAFGPDKNLPKVEKWLDDHRRFARRRTSGTLPTLANVNEFAQRPAGTPSAAVWNLVAPMAAGPAAGFAISDAETEAGRALVDSFRKDTDSQSTGIRHINEFLANQLDVEIREGHSGRAGTTGKNPVVFIPGADLIRTRSGSWQLVLHDLGHMIGNLLEAADPGFMNQHGADLIRIGLAEGSFATTHRDTVNFAPWDPAGLSTTPAEGFAEWVRRFIWDPESLNDASMPNHMSGIILANMARHMPAVLAALRDSHRMASAWADRSLESRLRSYAAGEAELRPKIGDTMKGFGRFFDRLLFTINAEHALGSRVVRPMMRGLKRVSSGMMAVAQDKMMGSDADVEAIAQQEYHVGGEVNRLLFGPPRHDKANKGMRIRETGSNAIAAIMAELGAADPALAARFAARFNVAGVRRTGTKAGHWLYLTDYDIQDVILAITDSGKETGRWAQFEYYVQYREAVNRARDRWDVLDADGKWVSTHFTEADANTALAALPPAVQPTLPGVPAAPARTGSVVMRPGMAYPGLTEGVDLSSLMQEIATVERANPDFRVEADRINKLMDQRVLAAVIMGQFTPAQAMTIVDSRESYAPLLRQFDKQSPGTDGGSLAARMVGTTTLPGAEPNSGIRRAYGSALPFKPLLEAIETNLRELLTGYNRHRTIKSVAALVQMAATLPNVPDEFRREMMRIMTPVPMSLMPAATLTSDEQARFVEDVVEAINKRTAQAQGTTVANLLPADLVSAADLTVDFGDGSTIWRAQKPKGINLVALFDGPGKGTRTLYEITDPILFDYFARVRESTPALKWWATVWRGVNQATRRGVLKTVEFVVRNLSRDVKTALVLGPREAGGAALIPGYFMAKAVVDSMLGGRRSRRFPGGQDIQDTELWGEALKAVNHPEHQARANTIWGSLAATLSEGVLIPGWSAMGWGTRLAHVPGQAVSTILKPLDLVAHVSGLNKLSDWGERLSRRGAYLSVIESGGTPERAQLAYDKVSGNFIGRGGSSTGNAMISTGLFLNAMLQTTYQLWDNLADPSKRGGTALRLGVAAATGVVSALITYAMMSDDDREKLKLQPEAERLKNMHIHVPGTDVVIRLPFAYGAEGAIESWGYNLTMNALLGESVAAGAMLQDSFKRVLSLDSLLGLLTPAGKLAVEFWANKALYDGREVIPGYLTDELPEMQYTPRTSETAKAIGEAAGISPVGLEHSINSLVGRNLLSVGRAVESGGESVGEFSDVPGLGGLTAREPRGFNSRPVQEVYDLAGEYERARSLVNRLTDEGRYDDARIQSGNEAMQRTALAYAASLQIRKLSKSTQAELAKDRPDRTLIQEWERLMTQVAAQALKPVDAP